ncbi:MAG: TonB-dependent receptor domain-containing protein [Bryobacteraceae bacterium]
MGVGSGTHNATAATAQQTIYYAFFVQDDFKITPKVNINLGLRYDYEGRTDRFDQLTNFDFNQSAPLQAPAPNRGGVLTFAGVGGASRLLNDPDRNNFAPRVGVAYRLTRTTVIRTGAGIFFSPTTAPSTAFVGSGFTASTSLVTSLDGVTPLTFLRNPYPDGINKRTGSSLGPATLLGQSVSFFDRANRTPYAGQWNFNVQQQLPGVVLLDVGYAASRGLKQTVSRFLNQLPDSALGLGDELRAQVSNPFFGQITVGPLSQRTLSRAQLLRPFPHFDEVTSQNATLGTSSYHSLQVKIEKRYTSGFSFLSAYTWSKTLDLDTGFFSGEALSGGGIQNWNNLRPDWAVSALDQTHRLVINSVYELPFGKKLRGAAGKLLAGWEVGAVFSSLSGPPLGIGSAVNTTFSQGGGQRPNWTGVTTRLSEPAPDRWFDTSQFSNPPPYAFGNAPRTFGGSRGDGTASLDLTAAKNTRLREKLQLQFRAEFFNLTNTPRFNPPNIVFGNQLFGVVNGQGNGPRVVQLALKLVY